MSVPQRRLVVCLKLAASALLLATVMGVGTAEASVRGRAPWCGNLSGDGLDDCNYFSFAQCRESVQGLGGFCTRNPAVAVYEDEPYAPRKRKARRYR